MVTKYKYIARMVLEAETILSIGSDTLVYDQDKPVDKDWNDLPYIPATAITGFLRKCIPDENVLFGDKKNDVKEGQGNGSYFICSDALLFNGEEVLEYAKPKPKLLEDKFYYRYLNLPLRQHTAINHLGAALNSSKFDNEFVFKGSRFKLEISLEVAEKDDTKWDEILNCFYRNDFYLGAGETNGYGLLKVATIKHKCFNLTPKKDDAGYLDFDVSLNGDTNCLKENTFKKQKKNQVGSYEETSLTFSGENSFFHFGAGIGDEDVYDANYQEDVVEWDNNKAEFKSYYVIPGSSIKGTLAHRVAYQFNKENKNTVEDILEKALKGLDVEVFKKTLPNTLEALKLERNKLEEQLSEINEIKVEELFKPYTGSNNKGVKKVFGIAKNSDKEEGRVGYFIVKDTYLLKKTYNEIVFNHNKIDRFTGGTIDTALFNEKVLHLPEVTFHFKYKKDLWKDDFIIKAVEDLEKGMLPIGGKVNKGHGILIKK